LLEKKIKKNRIILEIKKNYNIINMICKGIKKGVRKRIKKIEISRNGRSYKIREQ
jgi:hypothetical protein